LGQAYGSWDDERSCSARPAARNGSRVDRDSGLADRDLRRETVAFCSRSSCRQRCQHGGGDEQGRHIAQQMAALVRTRQLLNRHDAPGTTLDQW
jgi:hypothetical protein